MKSTWRNDSDTVVSLMAPTQKCPEQKKRAEFVLRMEHAIESVRKTMTLTTVNHYRGVPVLRAVEGDNNITMKDLKRCQESVIHTPVMVCFCVSEALKLLT